jgi:acyl carrier protein
MTSAPDPITAAIVAAIRQVLHDTGREPAAVEPGMLLTADIGLDSLDLAQTIVLLERSLGVDPFRAPVRAPVDGTARPAIRTVADLVGIYGQSISGRLSPDRP